MCRSTMVASSVTRPERDDTTPEANVARFLATHKIPDRQLALGLDLMARDEDEKTPRARHDRLQEPWRAAAWQHLRGAAGIQAAGRAWRGGRCQGQED